MNDNQRLSSKCQRQFWLKHPSRGLLVLMFLYGLNERCTEAKDAAKCEAEVRSGMARREKIREACKDKRGDELRACIREQRG